MKILIISYSYPPALNPRAFRWAAIAEQWSSEGHQVDVICDDALSCNEHMVINGVNVHRTGKLLAKLRNNLETPADSGRKYISKLGKVKRTLISTLRTLSKNGWRKLYWPDYTCLWYWNAARRAENLLAANDYDVMFSSSIPFTGHLVALHIKEKCPELKWVVDIGDPFCFSEGVAVNNFTIYRHLNIHFERKVFQLADAISVTTSATADRYCEIFPFAGSKINVIPPLLSVDPTSEIAVSREFRKDNMIRLVFLGTLYKTIRDPGSLLSLFSKLMGLDFAARLELHFYGDMGSCPDCFEPYNDLIDRKIFIHGLVDRKIAATVMNNADILINIGNDTAYQLPSKIVEYLATMKPILNFAKTEQDSSTSFLYPYEGVMCIVADKAISEKACFDRITNFIRYPQKIDIVKRKGQLDAFRIDAISKMYSGL